MVRYLMAVQGLLLLQAGKDLDLHYEKELGISVQKPKGQDWEFRTSGARMRDVQFLVAHTRENLQVEFFTRLPQSSSDEPKKVAEEEYATQLADSGNKEVRRQGFEDNFLPNKAGSGQRAWVIDLLIRDHSDRFTEWKLYCFIGRENRCLYKVCVTAPRGTYGKIKKEVDQILGSIRTYKLIKQ